MTLFRFCHTQENAFAFFIVFPFRKIAIGLRGLNFRLPVTPCNIDRLLCSRRLSELKILLLGGHAALKRNERLFPNRRFRRSIGRFD
jgi:hypothetical protein